MTASLPVVTDPDRALIVNPDRPEPIAVMLYDPRYRVAYCETCGWTRWVWTGSGFRCPCKSKDKATPPRGPLTVDATR